MNILFFFLIYFAIAIGIPYEIDRLKEQECLYHVEAMNAIYHSVANKEKLVLHDVNECEK
jgi:hypothetical protein